MLITLAYCTNYFWCAFDSTGKKPDIFFIVTFTRLNVKNLQSPGNLNWYITWETKNGLKSNLN